MNLFKGTGIAIITPFLPNGAVDLDALERLVDFWIEGNVEYLVVLGTTGESVVLTAEEKRTVVETVVKKTAGRVPVVLGHGGNNTANILHGFSTVDFSGISAILSVAPYYNKPTQAGLVAHFRAVADASPVPVILYNVPGRTGVNMSVNTTLTLAAHPNVCAIKEASGNMEQIMQIIAGKPADFEVIIGDDSITIPLIAVGASGVISVVANAYPREFSDAVRAALQGDFKTAQQGHYRVLKVVEHLFTEGNPAGIKAVMQLRGLCTDTLRLPLTSVSDDLRRKISQVVENF